MISEKIKEMVRRYGAAEDKVCIPIPIKQTGWHLKDFIEIEQPEINMIVIKRKV